MPGGLDDEWEGKRALRELGGAVGDRIGDSERPRIEAGSVGDGLGDERMARCSRVRRAEWSPLRVLVSVVADLRFGDLTGVPVDDPLHAGADLLEVW